MNKPSKTDLQIALSLCKKSFVSVGFFSLFINLLMLVPPMYMMQVYDRVLSSGSETTLLMLTLIMVFLLVTMGALEWVRSQVLVRVSTRLETLLDQRMFDACYKQGLYSGGMVSSSQPLSDMTQLRQFLTGNGLFAFFDAPWVPIYIGVMFIFHPLFGWVAVMSALLLFGLALINERATKPALAEANKEAAGAMAFANKNLSNVEVIASMGMMGSIRKRWQQKNHRVLELQAEASSKAGVLANISKTVRIILQSLVLGLGAYLAIKQELSPGLMIAGSILLGRALAPIDLLIGSWRGFVSARSQYARLNELLTNIPADNDKMSLPAPVGNVSVEAAVIAPPGAKTAVIKGISFAVNAGESVGIIGPSAAGKSTLARALIGIWPAHSGKVRVDGADIFAWNREEVGPYIGYLPQDIELFEGSISENIARFGDVDPEKVVEAAQMAGVHEMILRLPDGYDTLIGAHGGQLSGGQRQRVGLARAVYNSPRLIVLDEPNSNLDDVGEKALLVALAELKKRGSTVFIIAHRPSVLGSVDKILLLQDGQIKLFGPRNEVFAQLAPQQPQPVKKPSATVPVVSAVKGPAGGAA